MASLITTEVLKSAIGAGAAYVFGKILGRKEAERKEELKRKMCNLLWKMEFEVTPRLLKEVIRSEVEIGCIPPDEADDRLIKVMEARQKYGLLGGANVYMGPGGATSISSQPPVVPQNPADVVKIEELQAKAMEHVGPPTALSEHTNKKEKE